MRRNKVFPASPGGELTMRIAFALCGSLLRDERGTTAMEYAVIGTVLAVAIFGALGLVGAGLSGLYTAAADSAGNSLTNANGTFD